MSEQDIIVECEKCAMSPAYFIDTYCQIDDPNKPGSAWFPFRLWPAQVEALAAITGQTLLIALKARQLGITWLSIGFALWLMLFEPGSVILLFSRTGSEANELVRRLSGMHGRLPAWLQSGIVKDSDKELELSNGSRAKSFTTTKHSGRSFTASLVIIDEADFIDFLRQLLNAAEETIAAGGKLIMVSTSDKEKPNSRFKQVFRQALSGSNAYHPVFLPWSARPTRTAAWYAKKQQTKDRDDLYQEYPETPEQALSGRQGGKRFDPDWITNARGQRPLLNVAALANTATNGAASVPALPGLTVYEQPQPDGRYLISVDTSEGDITSDPSPATVFNADTWTEAAQLYGIFEMSILAGYVWQLGEWFNTAVILVERNNHGHAVLLGLDGYPAIYTNPFDKKRGWLTGYKSKIQAVDKTAEVLRDGDLIIYSENTLAELANLEAATLKAPEGDTDDLALTVINGIAGLVWPSYEPPKPVKKRRRSFTT